MDWVPDAELEPVDPRVVRRKADGLVRLTFTSHLRLVRCGDGRSVRELTSIRFLPGTDLEEYGVEDPRITPLYGRYYFTYVAVSRHGAATALGVTTDFSDFSREGAIFCCENKDVVLFPGWIGGAARGPAPAEPGHAVLPSGDVDRLVSDIIHWGHHGVLHGGGADWEAGRVGAGTPPIRIPGGWLEIYHGSRHTTTPGAVGKYSTGALLLDLDNPARILRRTPGSIFEPTAEFERLGLRAGRRLSHRNRRDRRYIPRSITAPPTPARPSSSSPEKNCWPRWSRSEGRASEASTLARLPIMKNGFPTGRVALAAALGLAAGLLAMTSRASDRLEDGFRNPPASARPWVYWWWLDGGVSKDGITRDLEEMERQGIAGALLFDAGEGGPRPPRARTS